MHREQENIIIDAANELDGYTQVMFEPFKKGVWRVHMIVKYTNGSAAKQMAYCDEKIVLKHIEKQFSLEDLKELLDREKQKKKTKKKVDEQQRKRKMDAKGFL
jgi:hypothetical protein